MGKNYREIISHSQYNLLEQMLKDKKPPQEILTALKKKERLSASSILGIDYLTRQDIRLIYRLAFVFSKLYKKHDLRLFLGKTIVNVFLENSTRTRVSFEIAGKTLGANVINISQSGSSMEKKGETTLDTFLNLEQLQPDLFILRTGEEGLPLLINKLVSQPLINAGDGRHEHPSQALLDGYTIMEEFGSIKNKKVLFVGDLLHSRCFGSLARLVNLLGGKVLAVGPSALLPQGITKAFKAKVFKDLSQALAQADVIYIIRLQLERETEKYFSSLEDYAKNYMINSARLSLAPARAIVMSPGPNNRDLDIASAVLTGRQSRIFKQVENGIYIRLALIYLLLNR